MVIVPPSPWPPAPPHPTASSARAAAMANVNPSLVFPITIFSGIIRAPPCQGRWRAITAMPQAPLSLGFHTPADHGPPLDPVEEHVERNTDERDRDQPGEDVRGAQEVAAVGDEEAYFPTSTGDTEDKLRRNDGAPAKCPTGL